MTGQAHPLNQARTGCNWGTPDGRCGQTGRLFPVGIRCPDHLPNHHLKTNDNSKGGQPA